MRAPSIVTFCFLAMTVVLTSCAKKPVEATPPPPAPASTEAPAPPTAPSEPEVPPTPVADPLVGDLDSVNRHVYEQGLIGDVYYDYDSDAIRDDARSRLQRNADFMKAHGQFLFTVEGHCDERGSIEYNLALGDRRASSAKNYLSSLGVADGTMKTVQGGAERVEAWAW
jgi:peptidoglycan-associated lipoprotein